MTRIEVMLKDGKCSSFCVDSGPTDTIRKTLAQLASKGQPFITWDTTLGTTFMVAKDQVAVMVLNAPPRGAE
ncbi:MAG: hypothetical protein GXY76_16975 [Chloroflexi bacterium]|nr:hypothetical protein [Chloroflexota bacterium]